MPTLENAFLALFISGDASRIELTDRKRGCVWRLDRSTAGYRQQADGPLIPFPTGTAERRGEGIQVSHRLPEGPIMFRWQLEGDGIAVVLESAPTGVAAVSLPGSFGQPDEPVELALPLYQGVLLRNRGSDWKARTGPGGHGAFSMGMAGILGPKGALLTVQETLTGWAGFYGAEGGRMFMAFEEAPCPVEGWQHPCVRLIPTDADLTALCKRYRAYLKERGDLVTWAEKIERKPILKNLFGALMAFTGYNVDSELDYAACARKLKAYGFEHIFFYPVRMGHYSLDFLMGGDKPVWLPDETLAALKSIEGVMVSPWCWIFEGLDDGSEGRRKLFRQDAAGSFMPHWKIDHFQWYRVCTSCEADYIRERLAGDLKAMDWLHFDVDATFPPGPCYNLSHAGHAGQPMGREADLAWKRRLFSPETVGNRIVSSEGFLGYCTPAYDIGSTKMMPGPDIACQTPVPMTLLVYHDSCVHDWWELHNYNAVPGWPVSDLGRGMGRVGTGLPKLKASLDALYGCPPNVFPFGRQYAWANPATRESFSFSVRLEEPGVQEALREALPVSRLHGKIGPLEMVSFAFLTEDRSGQTTAFADGTRIAANLSDRAQEVAPYGTLPPTSWREVAR